MFLSGPRLEEGCFDADITTYTICPCVLLWTKQIEFYTRDRLGVFLHIQAGQLRVPVFAP